MGVGRPNGDVCNLRMSGSEDLRIYLKRNDRFYASVIPFNSTKSDAKWSVERISPGEVDSTLALLQVASSKAGNDAQPRLALRHGE